MATSGQDTLQPFPSKLDIIDVLRGAAALLVVVAHLWGLMWAWKITFPRIGQLFDTTFAPDIWRVIGFPITQFGSLGVALFFAISGFCIHYGYMRGKEGADAGSFMLRRIFRIFPAFLVSLAGVILIIDGIFLYRGNVDYSFIEIVKQGSLLFNLFGDTQTINPVYWTLPIEFQLYVLYLLVLFLKKKIGIGKIVVWTFVLELTLFVLHFILQKTIDVNVHYTIFNTPLAFWFDWMIGAYVAECFLKGKRAFSNWMVSVPVVGLVLALLYVSVTPLRYMFGAMLGAWIIDVFIRKEFVGWVGKTFAWFGMISYSLYLWHLPIMSTAISWMIRNQFITNAPTPRFFIALITLVLIVIPISYLTYRYVELPGIVLGKKLVGKWGAYLHKRRTLSGDKDDSIVVQLPG